MEPYYQTKLGKLYHGDCLDILPEISGATACVTDPPYGLNFMGKNWDHGVPGIRYWKGVMDSCLPGAPLLAFGGTRTIHRLVCAIEDAGWEIRDGIEYFHWIYGSGFPKSHNISKTIDKAERGVPHGGADPTSPNHGKYKGGCSNDNPFGRGFGAGPGQFMAESGEKDDRVLVESAKQWEGYGTALKPAHEPICYATKPIEGTFANNALKHGVAGINIDGCLVGNTKRTPGYKNPGSDMVGNSEWNDRYGGGVRREVDQTEGRWPANVILQHHPECECIGTKKIQPKEGHRPNPVNKQSDGNIIFTQKAEGYKKNSYTDPDGTETIENWNCHPDCPIRIMDEQSGERKAGGSVSKDAPSRTGKNAYGKYDRVEFDSHTDIGGASRFFLNLPPEEQYRFKYTAKASKSERGEGNTHPTVKPLKLMEYLLTLVTMPERNLIIDPFCGSGSTLIACEKLGLPWVGIEKDEESCEISAKRIEGYENSCNFSTKIKTEETHTPNDLSKKSNQRKMF